MKESFPPLPAYFPSLSRQQGGFGLKYQHTKQRGAADICPAIISSSPHVVIRTALCFDVYNKLTRGAPREVCATLGVAQ